MRPTSPFKLPKSRQPQLLDELFASLNVSGDWSESHSTLGVAQSPQAALLDVRTDLSQVSGNWSEAESTFAVEHPSVENTRLLDVRLTPLRKVRVERDPSQANASSIPRLSKQGRDSYQFRK